ncbi:MAG: hypothetical protein PHV43_00665 [Candidatus Colwellbacteria bacterium]|nr:hypothetical protein [Candidatus Colwellbacteria bacterium]
MELVKNLLKGLGVLLVIAAIVAAVIAVGTLLYNKSQASDQARCSNYGAVVQRNYEVTSEGCFLEIERDRWVKADDICIIYDGSDICTPLDGYSDWLVVIEPSSH